MRIAFGAIVLLSLLAAHVCAQKVSEEPSTTTPEERVAAWAVDASLYTYVVPDDQDFILPMVSIDRGWLHLEARYNYEDLETVSGWFGYTAAIDGAVSVKGTAMIGGVLGSTSGIAPGYRIVIDWWCLELSSEGELVFDLHERKDSYFFTWSELSLTPVDWGFVGLVAQRTRVYQAELDIQRGFLGGSGVGPLRLTVYVFNPDKGKPTFVIGVGVEL